MNALELFKAVVAAGYTLSVEYDGEVDYKGVDPQKAWEACEACSDDMGVYIEKPGAKREWAMVIAGLTDDEQVADYTTGGFIEQTMESLG
ncbi:MAG: hypothetical protein KDK08_05470 [Rhizobiaceae bacterium]|nr:hypothetical protein [Rhizobiaceae bacterium]MCC0000918.1 hypothetical protein [Methylobacteriaceae bacterium]